MEMMNGPDFMDGEVPNKSFQESVQSEGMKKEKSLLKIRMAARERSDSVQSENAKLSASLASGEVSTTDWRKTLFQAIPEPYPHSTEFQRVIITDTGESVDKDTVFACKKLQECMDIRGKYLNAHPPAPQDMETFDEAPGSPPGRSPLSSATEYRRRSVPVYNIFEGPIPSTLHGLHCTIKDGVMAVRHSDPSETHTRSGGEGGGSGEIGLSLSSIDLLAAATEQKEKDEKKEEGGTIFPVISFTEFVDDYYTVRRAVHAGPVLSYCFKQLELLAAKFSLHTLLNGDRELEAQKSVPHRDFYNCRKVDTHVHHSACMNQKHLLRFIKHKLKHYPNEAVIFRDGRFLTLGEVFKSLNLTAYDLSIDTLDMHANNTFHRFDRFNLKYNPAGQSRLREIFLKTDNVLSGRYLAEVTNEVLSDLESSKYQLVEWRISIYGRKASEWASLARWFYVNKLANANLRWLIQVPRLYQVYKGTGEIENFEQMLHNIFQPLFDVTLNPQSNPPLHYFLQTVVGFDSVDDESRPEHDNLSKHLPNPLNWNSNNNPPYAYWMYYMYANICALNQLRASRGLSTFQYRPHCGEAGDVDHLVSTYLTAHQINHGILLRKNAGLHHLYYLSQVGIAMSPLSNNKLFLDYNKNPFPKYFELGMNVSLSTDDPLMLHYTKDALLEEYSVAAQVWKLTSTDSCEIARNSVLQSGFERKYKLHFLGRNYSDIRETNVPEIRLTYRQETLDGQLATIRKYASK